MSKFKKWVLTTLGYKYILNVHTMEVHDINTENRACGIDKMASHNKAYIGKRRFDRLIAGGSANGCRFCMKEFDKEI